MGLCTPACILAEEHQVYLHRTCSEASTTSWSCWDVPNSCPCKLPEHPASAAILASSFTLQVIHRVFELRFALATKDSLAEWSKALAQGASPQERGLEPHSCHFALQFKVQTKLHSIGSASS